MSLKQRLAKTGPIRITNWNVVQSLCKLILEESITVESSEWNDDYKNSADWHVLDLTNMETWSTYSHLVSMTFYIKNNKVKCDVIKSDKASYRYSPTVDWTATLTLKAIHLNLIKSCINSRVEDQAEQAYEEFLYKQRKQWTKEYIKNNY